MKKFFVALGLLTALTIASGVGQASAAGVFGDVCDRPEAQASAACNSKSTDDPISGDNGIVSKIANIVALVGGALAVVFILIGSLRYVTSSGDSGAVKSAKNLVIGALIGIAIIVLARTLIYFVLKYI